MMRRPLLKTWLACTTLLLLPSLAGAENGPGSRVPPPTAPAQELNSVANSLYPNGFQWTPVSVYQYDGNGHTTFGGGTASTSSVLTANVVNTADGGFRVNLPSGATGYAYSAYSSTGALTFAVTPSTASTDMGFVSGAGFKFYSYGGGTLIASIRGDQVNFSAPFYGTSAASFPSYGEWSGGYGPAVPTYLVNNSTYPVVIGASSTTQTGYVIDLAKPVIARSTISGVPGSGTNIAGANLTLAGGQSTGTGAEGVVNIATSGSGATGTALNALTTRATVSAGGFNLLTGTYQAAGVPGYTGTIPTTAQSFHFQGGVLVGYTDSAGTLHGN